MESETVKLSEPEARLYMAGVEYGIAQGLKLAAQQLRAARDSYAAQMVEQVKRAPKGKTKAVAHSAQVLQPFLQLFVQIAEPIELEAQSRSAEAAKLLTGAINSRKSKATQLGETAGQGLTKVFATLAELRKHLNRG